MLNESPFPVAAKLDEQAIIDHTRRWIEAVVIGLNLCPFAARVFNDDKIRYVVTDAFRALALRLMGYRTDVVEFVDIEHTARNVMIRAVRGGPAGDRAVVDEYLEMRRFLGVTPYIERALGEPFQRILGRGTDPGGPPC